MASRAAIHRFFSLSVAYQPFLSSTRNNRLTSILSTALPHYNWLPVEDTSLRLPLNADIVLLSRGGKPFAPLAQPITPKTLRDNKLRQQDWDDSSEKYISYVQKWRPYEKQLESLIQRLKQFFPEHVIASQTFEEYLRQAESDISLKDQEKLRPIWQQYIELKESTKSLYSILETTKGIEKAHARKYFNPTTLRAREYVIEDHRDRFDLLRFELEQRFWAMAQVGFRDTDRPPKPWILVPEDPISAWGEKNFPGEIQKLLLCAERRFLGDVIKERELETGEPRFKKVAAVLKEKTMRTPLEAALTWEAAEGEEKKQLEETYGAAELEDIFAYAMEVDEEFGLDEAIEYIDELDEEPEAVSADEDEDEERGFDAEESMPMGPIQGDEDALWIPARLGRLEADFKTPYTEEDKAIVSMADAELVKAGAWRVAN
jgi:hypothetical protein